MVKVGAQRGVPPPQLVWYNDWRQVAVAAPGAFVPELPVSVIVPYYAQSEELARTLAALEGQTYPRDLFEVVVVDDGSPEPLARLRSTPLDVKVVRQEDLGFGLARARNTGVRAAAHDVLLFLDGDLLPEAEWLSAHARWHHAAPDAVTLGLWARVSMDGVDAETIRKRPGTLRELFAGRKVDLFEYRLVMEALHRTDDLTSKADDLFRVVAGGNLGIRRGFYDLVGGFDESFTQWGGEDTEFGYRAYVRGGLLVPVRDAFAWHQGPWEEGRAEKEESRKLQYAKLAHLIAHPDFRSGVSGRTFTVPQYVVTIEAGDVPAERLLKDVEWVLSGPTHDLVVRLELPEGHAGRAWLERHLGPDPRVRVAPSRPALEAFPASPFQVALPPGKPLNGDVVRLCAELGDAVVGRAVFSDGSRASIIRAWALHRALRTPWEAFDFGEVVTIPPDKLQPESAPAPAGLPSPSDAPVQASHGGWARLLTRLRKVEGPSAAWRFIRWFCSAGLRRVWRRLRTVPPRRAPTPAEAPSLPVRGASASPPRAEYPLGVEIVARGARSRAVFETSRRVARTTAGQPVDVVVADTAAEAAGVAAPVVVLSEAPPLLSVPALDPRRHNPIGWRREVGDEVGALGPLDRLPPGCHANRVVGRDDLAALGSLHHLEDAQAFHADVVTRAGALVRLAATGVVVHLADGDRRLAPYVGAELFELMTREVRDLDIDGREALSIRMRRTALREHSLTSRARQVAERVLADPPRLPLVSVLLATKRPSLLPHALEGVARQTYPRLELILGLHGEGFADVDQRLADLPMPATVVRIGSEQPLGAALNLMAAAAAGTLLTKMDDDDAYGREHLWDLVLAHEYSQAPLVGKLEEFVHLAAPNVTVQLFRGDSERYRWHCAGGAMLVQRDIFDRVEGFACVPHSVDTSLLDKIGELGDQIYVTHGTGFVVVRHGEDHGHTWNSLTNEWFIDNAYCVWPGWGPDLVPIQDMAASYLPPIPSRAPLRG